MPPVFGAIASVAGGISATLAAGGVGAALINIGASVALSALSRALAPRPDAPREPGVNVRFSAGEDEPLAFVMGYAAVSGWPVGPAWSGQHGTSSSTPNRWLDQVYILSDVPMTAIKSVIIHGETLDYTAFASGGPTSGPYHQYFYVRENVAAYMLDHYSGYPKRPWRESMTADGMTAVAVTHKYNSDLWGGNPERAIIVGEGMPLYDPRKDSTAGGAGAHRWANPATWEYSANPVVMIYNILRGITIEDVGVWGLKVAPEDLPYAQWAAAMDVCDEAVALDGGGTEPRYRAGIEITTDREPLDVIGQLLKACGGDIADCGGTWHVTAGPPPPPVLWITDDDVITTESRELQPFPSLAKTINSAAATFPSPDAAWEPQAAEPYYRPDLEAEDGGRPLTAPLEFGAVPFPRQVRRLMREAVDDHRRMRTHVLPLAPSALHVMPLDTISWTSEENGYVDKLFEVRSKTFDPRSLISRVVVRERDPSDYDPDAFLDAVLPEAPDTTEVDATVIGIDGFAVQPWTLTDGTNNRRPAIRIVWNPAQSAGEAVLGLEFEIRSVVTGLTVIETGTTNVVAGKLDVYQGVLPAHQYEVRGRIVANGREAAWSGWALVTAPNVKIATYDLDVDNFSAAGLAVFGGDLRSDGYSFANKTGWVINSNGTANFFGKVTVDWLVANAVTTEKINLNAVHDYQSVVSTASNSVSLVFTGLSSAYDLLMMGEVEINSANPGVTHEGYGEMFVNGTRIGPRSYGLSSDRSTITVTRTRAAVSGTNTVTFDGGGANINADVNSLAVLVLKR